MTRSDVSVNTGDPGARRSLRQCRSRSAQLCVRQPDAGARRSFFLKNCCAHHVHRAYREASKCGGGVNPETLGGPESRLCTASVPSCRGAKVLGHVCALPSAWAVGHGPCSPRRDQNCCSGCSYNKLHTGVELADAWARDCSHSIDDVALACSHAESVSPSY